MSIIKQHREFCCYTFSQCSVDREVNEITIMSQITIYLLTNYPSFIDLTVRTRDLCRTVFVSLSSHFTCTISCFCFCPSVCLSACLYRSFLIISFPQTNQCRCILEQVYQHFSLQFSYMSWLSSTGLKSHLWTGALKKTIYSHESQFHCSPWLRSALLVTLSDGTIGWNNALIWQLWTGTFICPCGFKMVHLDCKVTVQNEKAKQKVSRTGEEE